MRYPGFVGPSARSRSRIACDDRTVNLYVEKVESGTGKAPYVMYRTPGYSTWVDLGTGSHAVRGLFTLNGVGYAVAASTLYQLPATLGGSATILNSGVLSNVADQPVSIAANGDGGFQLMIAADSKLYVFDTRTHVLTQIPNIAPTVVVFLDATFYALNPGTSTLFASNIEDGSTWNALNVFQRTQSADKIQTMARMGPELVIFGNQTTTVLSDVGNAAFPLAPNSNIFIQRGISAPLSLAVQDNVAFWLGQGLDGGGTVYRMQGYTPQPISTSAVEYAINTYSYTGDAEAFIYMEEGHQFYVLNFPTANATWVYDIHEGLWHERGEFSGTDYNFLPIRGSIFFSNAVLVGSRTTGKVYQQSLAFSTITDGVTGIRWNRRAPHIHQEKMRMTYARLELDAEVGVGLSSSIASDANPQVYLRWSNDGGQSFGNVHQASLGKAGTYGTRVWWRMLGNGRDRVFDMYGAANVVTALVDAYIDVRPGTS